MLNKDNVSKTIKFLQELTKVFNKICELKFYLEKKEVKNLEEYTEINDKLEKINKYFFEISKIILNIEQIIKDKKFLNEEMIIKINKDKDINFIKEASEIIKTQLN